MAGFPERRTATLLPTYFLSKSELLTRLQSSWYLVNLKKGLTPDLTIGKDATPDRLLYVGFRYLGKAVFVRVEYFVDCAVREFKINFFA